MAFTNWSLKPSVEFYFVGLRNFIDILGIRPVAGHHIGLLGSYVVCLVLLLTGLLGHFWSVIDKQRGLRWGGLLLGCWGIAVLAFSVLEKADQGIMLAGILVVSLGGVALLREDNDWQWGWGVVGPSLIVCSSLGLIVLHQPMWHTYEVLDVRFWKFLYNTLYLMLGLPFSIFGSLALALLLNEPLAVFKGKWRFFFPTLCIILAGVIFLLLFFSNHPDMAVICSVFLLLCAAGAAFNVVVFRTIYYLPTFTAGVALMILWKALYNPETGPINVWLEYLFSLLGLDLRGPRWLSSIVWAKPALIIMGVWTGIGGMNMLLYLAGLSTVSKDLLDAARVDGAGAWMRFRHVLWPHLAPTTFFILIISIIGGLQGGFEQARIMTFGGPAGATTTLIFYIYNIAFQELDLGKASAVSWVLFAFVFATTTVNWKFGKGIEIEY